jgi:hypothetical protein
VEVLSTLHKADSLRCGVEVLSTLHKADSLGCGVEVLSTLHKADSLGCGMEVFFSTLLRLLPTRMRLAHLLRGREGTTVSLREYHDYRHATRALAW